VAHSSARPDSNSACENGLKFAVGVRFGVGLNTLYMVCTRTVPVRLHTRLVCADTPQTKEERVLQCVCLHA